MNLEKSFNIQTFGCGNMTMNTSAKVWYVDARIIKMVLVCITQGLFVDIPIDVITLFFTVYIWLEGEIIMNKMHYVVAKGICGVTLINIGILNK